MAIGCSHESLAQLSDLCELVRHMLLRTRLLIGTYLLLVAEGRERYPTLSRPLVQIRLNHLDRRQQGLELGDEDALPGAAGVGTGSAFAARPPELLPADDVAIRGIALEILENRLHQVRVGLRLDDRP